MYVIQWWNSLMNYVLEYSTYKCVVWKCVVCSENMYPRPECPQAKICNWSGKSVLFDRMYSWTLETSSPQDFCRQRKLVLILEKLLLSSGLLEKGNSQEQFWGELQKPATYTSHNLLTQKMTGKVPAQSIKFDRAINICAVIRTVACCLAH